MSAIQGFQLSQGGDIEKYDYNALDNKLELDTTLQISGQAADAKSTGDKISTIENNLSNLIDDNSNSATSTWSSNKINGEIIHIDDTQTQGNDTTTWSSEKIYEEIHNLINNDTSTPASDTTWSSAAIQQQIEDTVRNSILSSMDGNNRVFSLLNLIYPVGSIFMTVNNTNPGSYIENTVWEPWGQGRVVIGVDSNDADFNKALITGGEKKHTLTVAEMPAHGHYYTPNR